MAFCTNCGNQVADSVKFCTSCGTPIAVAAPVVSAAPVMEQQPPAAPPVQPVQPVQQQVATPPPPAPQPVPVQTVQQQPVQRTAQQPLYAAPPQAVAVYQEEPISTGGYIGILLLMMLPVVNLICAIIWACGGCSKRNQTNFARALLVWMLIGTVLGGLVFLAGSLLFGNVMDSLKELGSQIGGAAGTE